MTSDLERAIEIALSAHSGQKDKGGQPYILHPLRVMLAMEPGPAQVAAVLHDVIEDSEDWQIGDLEGLAFDDEVIAAVNALTRRPDEAYYAYISRLSRNAIAVRVKVADLTDNLRRERIPNPTEADEGRWAQYTKALQTLTKQSSPPA